MNPKQIEKIIEIYEEATGVKAEQLLSLIEDSNSRFGIRQAVKIQEANWIVFYYERIDEKNITRLFKWKVAR